MKLYIKDLSTAVQKISSGKVQAVLLYGTEHGLIEECVRKISQGKVLQRTSYTSNDAILTLLNSMTFAGEREVVAISGISSNDTKLLDLLGNQTYHFPVFIAESCPTSSKLYSAFNTKEDLIIIPCYSNDYDLLREAANKLYPLKASKAALEYLIDISEHNMLLLATEIDKIKSLGSEQEIDLHMMQELAQGETATDIAKLAFAVIQGDRKIICQQMQSIASNQTSPILVMRAVIKYCYLLHNVIMAVSRGEKFESAVRAEKIPYSNQGSFRSLLGLPTKRILAIIEYLTNAEISFKSLTTPNALNNALIQIMYLA